MLLHETDVEEIFNAYSTAKKFFETFFNFLKFQF